MYKRQVIRIPAEQISTFNRPSKGVKVMNINEGEKVVTIGVVDRLEEDDDENENAEVSENAVENVQENAEETTEE